MKSLADKFFETLPASQRDEYRAFEQEILQKHLKRREKNLATSPFILDRRNALLGWGKREVLKEPPTADRLCSGTSTCDRRLAEYWVVQHYAPQLWREMKASGSAVSDVRLTVAQATDRYVASLGKVDPDTRTIKIPRKHKARVSKLRVHIVPRLGSMLLSTVVQDHVSLVLNAMTVTVRENGVTTTRPAMHSTRLETLKALAAVWRHTFRNTPVPFREAYLEKTAPSEERPDVDANDLEELDKYLQAIMKEGVMTLAEVEQSLIGALHMDQQTLRCRHLKNYLPISAHVIALLVGLGLRVSELVKLQWQNINLEKLIVMVPQSKIVYGPNGKPNKDTHRLVPIQRSLVPWIRSLMAICGVRSTRGCKSFVVQLSRSALHSSRQASEDSVIARVSRALKYAGTKPQRKSSHFGRATHVSIATMTPGLETRIIKAIVGHAAFEGETNRYFKLRWENLRPIHHRYLQLASPTDVAKGAKEFVKGGVNERKKRCRQK